MSNRAMFIAFLALFIFIVLVIFLVTIICSSIGVIESMVDVLKSPAMTSNITIEYINIASESANITMSNFSGQVNSKILDLIIASMH